MEYAEYYVGDEKKLKVIGKNIIIQQKNEKWINVFVPSDKKRWVEIVKNVSGRKWNLEKICWELPYTKDTLKQLWELIGKKNIALNFKIDVNIPKEYNYEEIDPDHNTVYDVLKSIKLEEWKPEIDEEFSIGNSKDYSVKFQSHDSKVRVRSRMCFYNDSDNDMYFSFYINSKDICYIC